MVDLTREDLAYIAGFLDGDGSILAQIVKGSAYRYKHRIRISVVFYQKKRHHWLLIWLKSKLGVGNIRIKKDGMAEFVVLGNEPVRRFLVLLEPFLKIKKPLCKLVLNIIEDIQKIDSEASFIEVCRLVDKTAEYAYSKKRMITSLTVQESIKLPVETEEG